MAAPVVWDERRWRRSARCWQIAVLAVVAAGAVLVYRAWSDEGPRVTAEAVTPAAARRPQ